MRRERLAGRLAARKPLDLRGPRRRLFGRQLVLGRARLAEAPAGPRSRCLRSERQPYISRLSFSIVSFRKAISASAPDTFASAFAARASAAARAVFRAEMLDPPVIGGIESHRPIRRYNIPPARVVPPPISPRETVARSEPGSANRSPRAGSPAAPR